MYVAPEWYVQKGKLFYTQAAPIHRSFSQWQCRSHKMMLEWHLLLLTCQQEERSQENELHSTNASEEMDSTEPALASYHGSPTHRGKRAAQSPVLSPTKAPLYKKQHWDAPGVTQHQDSSHESKCCTPSQRSACLRAHTEAYAHVPAERSPQWALFLHFLPTF